MAKSHEGACPHVGSEHEIPCTQCGACEADEGGVPDKGRREILQAAVKFSSVMATAGLCATSLLMGKDANATVPQDPNEVNKQALQNLINYAIDNANMNQAVQLFGAQTNLEPEVIQELLLFTNNELTFLRNIRNRFRSALELSGLSQWQVVEHNTN